MTSDYIKYGKRRKPSSIPFEFRDNADVLNRLLAAQINNKRQNKEYEEKIKKRMRELACKAQENDESED